MSNWNDLKRSFRDALIDAFNVDGLDEVLLYRCQPELEQLTGRHQARTKIADDVIAHAVRGGWLETLAEGALAENSTHTGLSNTVPPILAGVTAAGKAFYQTTAGDDESQAPSDASLRAYLEWMAQQSERLALSLLDPTGSKTASLELAKVFINLRATPREWAMPDEPSVRVRERTALAAVHAKRQIILLGDPGSGKSMLLRFLVFCLARAALEPQAGWLQELKWQRERLCAGEEDGREGRGEEEGEP